MRKLLLALFCVFSFLFFSCEGKITSIENKDGSQTVSFYLSTDNFASRSINKILGLDENSNLFTEEDVIQVLQGLGLNHCTAAIKNNVINAKGDYPPAENSKILNHFLDKDGKIDFSAAKIRYFYSKLDTDAKNYIDLLMAPVLTGEKNPDGSKISEKDYEAMLSSLYGPKLAESIIIGMFRISHTNKNGKTENRSATLGSLFTLEK